MLKYKYKNLHEFINKFDFNNLSSKDLIISDIDGVFFKSIFDIREIIGIIGNNNINHLEEILKINTSFWVFSNRFSIFRFFPFIKQIIKTIKDITKVNPVLITNYSKFTTNNLPKYYIILNAKKPSLKSQELLSLVLRKFRKVIYISAQDTPFYYTDKLLVDNLTRNENFNNLIFVEINPWQKNFLSK